MFQEGLSPIHLKVEETYHRAAPGGTGSVKTIGNYAPVSIKKYEVHQWLLSCQVCKLLTHAALGRIVAGVENTTCC
jgi:hypothetical protein